MQHEYSFFVFHVWPENFSVQEYALISSTDLPPKDIIDSAPPILYYAHDDDNDRDKGVILKGGNLDWKGYGSPSIHPYIVDSLVFPSARRVPRGAC